MQILIFQRRLEGKYEPFERDLKHSNANSQPFEPNSKHLNANSYHSKGIRSIQMHILTSDVIGRFRMLILTIQKGFKVFKYTFKQFEKDWKHSNPNSNQSKVICEPFESDSKHSNVNSKGIRSI